MAEEPHVGAIRQRQRLNSLALATASKKRRRVMKEKIKAGKLDALALVEGSDERYEKFVAKWRIEQLLALVPKLGPVGRVEIYSVAKVSPRMKVSALDYERRKHLAKLCRQYAEGQG